MEMAIRWIARSFLLLLGSCTYFGTNEYHSPASTLNSTTAVYEVKSRSTGFSVFLDKAEPNGSARNVAISDRTYKVTIKNLGDSVNVRTRSYGETAGSAVIRKKNFKKGEHLILANHSSRIFINPVSWDRKNIWLEFTVQNPNPEKMKGLSLVESHSP